MKYCWGAGVVLSLAFVGGCGGGGTTDGDAGTDAFVAPHDAFIGGDGPVQHDTGTDASTVVSDTGTDTNPPLDANSPIDANVDGGHDAATTILDGGHDAATTTAVDGGCVTIDNEVDAHQACGTGHPDCPTGFTCQPMGGIIASSQCIIACAGSGSSCPCDTACIPHDAIEGAPAYNSCDTL